MMPRRTSPATPTDLDPMLSAADAAVIAGRSVRTIRRAYRRGSLRAYRDGSGRGVRISQADLHRWMTASPASGERSEPERAVADVRHRKLPSRRGPSENLRLLNAARQLRESSASGSGAGARK